MTEPDSPRDLLARSEPVLPPVAPGAVVAEISTSLDGYVTGPDDRVGEGLGVGGEVLHHWVFGRRWTYADSAAGDLGVVRSALSTHLRYRVVR